MYTRKKLNIKKIILFIILLISLGFFCYSSYKIIAWYFDNKETKEQTDQINKSVKIIEAKNEEEKIIKQKETPKKEDPYWDLIKEDMLSVDFEKLKKSNSDLKGWIQVKGTNINYPYVQTKNNTYYLKKNFYKKYNDAGWIFQDYRNNGLNDKNTIIYGHARLDGSMFGTLKNTLKNSWLSNKNNYVVKISDGTKQTLWQVFSVYYIENTDDYIRTDFASDKDYLDFLNLIKNRSRYNFKTTVNETDKILTLSTCYSNERRLALHAKLIKEG